MESAVVTGISVFGTRVNPVTMAYQKGCVLSPIRGGAINHLEETGARRGLTETCGDLVLENYSWLRMETVGFFNCDLLG